MKLHINGEERDFGHRRTHFTVADLLEALGMKADRVAVELNRDIVPRDRWSETSLNDGDQLEVVHFVGGGAYFLLHRANVQVHASTIEGLGVFAQDAISAGKAILEIDDSRIVDETHALSREDDPRHCDYLEAGKVTLMGYPERHINHSCDPNSYVRTENGRRYVIAWRDISVGEEITYDYCINGSGDTVWHCHCGAARCRHVIHSDFFHLPPDLQREYLPRLDGWFRREHETEVSALEKRVSVCR